MDQLGPDRKTHHSREFNTGNLIHRWWKCWKWRPPRDCNSRKPLSPGARGTVGDEPTGGGCLLGAGKCRTHNPTQSREGEKYPDFSRLLLPSSLRALSHWRGSWQGNSRNVASCNSERSRNGQMISTNEVWGVNRGVVNTHLRWHHFIEGPECQILNVGFSACLLSKGGPWKVTVQEGIVKTVLGRLAQCGRGC